MGEIIVGGDNVKNVEMVLALEGHGKFGSKVADKKTAKGLRVAVQRNLRIKKKTEVGGLVVGEARLQTQRSSERGGVGDRWDCFDEVRSTDGIKPRGRRATDRRKK